MPWGSTDGYNNAQAGNTSASFMGGVSNGGTSSGPMGTTMGNVSVGPTAQNGGLMGFLGLGKKPGQVTYDQYGNASIQQNAASANPWSLQSMVNPSGPATDLKRAENPLGITSMFKGVKL